MNFLVEPVGLAEVPNFAVQRLQIPHFYEAYDEETAG